MPPGLGQQLLNLIRALAGPVAHTDPPGHFPQQPAFLQPVPQRPRRVQELQFHDRACRYDARRKLVSPCLPQLVLQDAEQPRRIDQVKGGAHQRYACLSSRNSSKSPRSAISPRAARGSPRRPCVGPPRSAGTGRHFCYDNRTHEAGMSGVAAVARSAAAREPGQGGQLLAWSSDSLASAAEASRRRPCPGAIHPGAGTGYCGPGSSGRPSRNWTTWTARHKNWMKMPVMPVMISAMPSSCRVMAAGEHAARIFELGCYGSP
jgi:hypothetical protein